MKRLQKAIPLALILSLLLSGCGSSEDLSSRNNTSKDTTTNIAKPDINSSPNTDTQILNFEDSEPITQSDSPSETAYIYTNMGSGGFTTEFKAIEIGFEGPLTIDILCNSLSQITGLDYFNADYIDDNGIHIDWAPNSTLIANLDDRDQQEDFTFYDEDSMRWFMMDSLWKTLIENYGNVNVYYSMNGWENLKFDSLSLVSEFPADSPYMGSAFYYAHADVRGEDIIDLDTAIAMVQDAIDKRGQYAPVITQDEDEVINGVRAYTFSATTSDKNDLADIYYYAVSDDGHIYYLDFVQSYDWILYNN